MKTLLITGANGYLGRNLLAKLKHQNFNVRTLTRDKSTMKNSYPEWEHYDVSDFEDDNIPFKDIDIVLHSAFARANKGGKAIAESIEFTRKLIEKTSNYQQITFVNISTQEVYGANSAPWKESDEPQPNTIYGTAKYYTELLTHHILDTKSINYTNIRLAGIIGKDTENRMVNKFVHFAIANSELNIQGGKQTFSQIYIDDVTAGILALFKEYSQKLPQIVNLGYLKSYNIMEIANIVKEEGKNKQLPKINVNLKESDIKLDAILDSSLFYEIFNWKPEYDMEKIINELFKNKITS